MKTATQTSLAIAMALIAVTSTNLFAQHGGWGHGGHRRPVVVVRPRPVVVVRPRPFVNVALCAPTPVCAPAPVCASAGYSNQVAYAQPAPPPPPAPMWIPAHWEYNQYGRYWVDGHWE